MAKILPLIAVALPLFFVDAEAAAAAAPPLLRSNYNSGSDSETPFHPFVWPHDPPPDAPFLRSTLFTEVEFTGRYATYGGADTWYPTWGGGGSDDGDGDDLLHSPWTDGCVRDDVTGARHCAGSACRDPSCASTTGFASVRGNDPFNLTVTDVGTFESGALPYHGRYPCGSLAYNGTWFYGTYALDNENHEPGLGGGGSESGSGSGTGDGGDHDAASDRRRRRLTAGYCGNWCVQGPFVGFRWSTDRGRTWHEPRPQMSGWDDNVFGERASDNRTTKVKFGAPHVVDYGRDLRWSADNKMYVVGHGASRPESPTSWMQGSEIYLARVEPTVEAALDGSRWEFWAGSEEGGGWVSGDVSRALPILAWGNRTGVTTMTYVPAVRRYLTVVSTPTFSPFTRRQFDTYILESVEPTGPFRLVTYMREFGPEAYFVNIPSKFMAEKIDEKDGSLRLFLSYSANFAFHDEGGPNPPGSGYHWTLQEVKLKK